MLTPIFRDASSHDAPLILSFLKKLAEYEGKPEAVLTTIDDIRFALFERKTAHAVLCEIENTPVGMAIWAERFSPYSGGINLLMIDLFIEQNWRGKNLGSLFFEKLKEIAVANNYKKVEWFVDESNSQAKEFYKKQGGSRLVYSEHWNLKI